MICCGEFCVFLVLMLALWTFAMAIVIGDSSGGFSLGAFQWATVVGLAFAYWAIGLTAFLDWISRHLANGIGASSLFASLVAGVAFVVVGLVAQLPAAVFSATHFYRTYAYITALVVVCYFLRNILLSARTR
jgi:hypothetical protein